MKKLYQNQNSDIRQFGGEMISFVESFIHSSAVVMGMVTLGKNCSIWPQATLRADLNKIILGQGVNIQDHCVLHTDSDSELQIGDYSLIGHNAVLHGCKIGCGCMIGINSLVLDNAEIGDFAMVMAGSTIRGRTKIPPMAMVLPDSQGGIKIFENKAKPLKTIAGSLEYIELAQRASQNQFSKLSLDQIRSFELAAERILGELTN